MDSHLFAPILSLFELERRLDIVFSKQVLWQLDNQVKAADHIVLRTKYVMFYGIWTFRRRDELIYK